MREHMSTVRLQMVALVLSVLLAGCRSGASSAPTPSPWPAPSAATLRPDVTPTEGPANGETLANAADTAQAPKEAVPVATAVTATRAVCTPDEARAIVEGFLDAYNRGEQQALAKYFGRKFKWYSATNAGEPHFVSYHADGALEYLERRHGLGERLKLREFHVSDPAGRAPRDLVNFWYILERTFEGKTYRAVGKGAMDCEAREIFVWSIGGEPIS